MRRFFLCMIAITCFSSCNESDNQDSSPFTGQAMTMQYRVKVGKPLNREERLQVDHIITATFEEIDLIYNKWNPRSEVSRLNRSSAEEKVPLSPELNAFLLEAEKAVALTDGRFDPTVESVQKIWKKHLVNGELPDSREIARASEAVGWEKIHIEKGVFWKDDDRVELDLGGIAKGYAIDLITQRLNAAGFPDTYVEWGGEIRTSGHHPDKRPWRIMVSNLGNPDPNSALAIVDMNNNAVAASGDYLQNWTVQGKTFFHVIDPATCSPLVAGSSSVCCATVIADDCMTADVLATTSMLFQSPEEAKDWLEKVKKRMPGLQYWVSSRGKQQ